MASKIISFTLNGRPTEVLVQPLTTLGTVLREQLDLTAAKSGCRQGGCGSCTALLNGQPVLSCILPVDEVEGQQVITLEGITPADGLHPIQEAFYENFAVQCGYCSPGMILVTKALLDSNPQPSREQIIDSLTGNYCRCTGYEPVIKAVEDAARRINGHGDQ